jgi:type II secretory pathway predicted ATPase ExeA
MIRSFYGLQQDPFCDREVQLLSLQQEICDTLSVHSQQGGLCLIVGIPGTGKTVIKEHLENSCDKRQVMVCVNRTLHTYTNTLKILCTAFAIEPEGNHFACEKRLIEEAVNLNRIGKSLITVIDDAHLMQMDTLRRLRLLFEEFPKNHNIILIGQPVLLSNLALSVNADIKSRVTYSAIARRVNADQMKEFPWILLGFSQVLLFPNIFTFFIDITFYYFSLVSNFINFSNASFEITAIDKTGGDNNIPVFINYTF